MRRLLAYLVVVLTLALLAGTAVAGPNGPILPEESIQSMHAGQ